MAKQDYDLDDFVCCECIEDHALKAHIAAEGTTQTCVLCGRTAKAVTIAELGAILFDVIETFFVQGEYSYDGQEGDSLSWVVQEVMGQYLDCEDCLLRAVRDADPTDPHDGDAPFIELDASYKFRHTSLAEHYAEWRAIKSKLKHGRRFFNDDAKQFFDSLFVELEALKAHGEKYGDPELEVVRTLPVGTALFRGRAADSEDALKYLLRKPAKELAAPPPESARVGRMNAEGISVFYGALDRKTCLAELRPSIGHFVVTGRFNAITPLSVLDFARLERAYTTGEPLSYFQDDATTLFQRRGFLRELHRLIAEPVLPGQEHEYLITQFLAEYLAYVRDKPLAALLYNSVQRKGGTNIVVFSAAAEGTKRTFPLAFYNDSAEARAVEAVDYKSRNIGFTLFRRDVLLDHEDLYGGHDD